MKIFLNHSESFGINPNYAIYNSAYHAQDSQVRLGSNPKNNPTFLNWTSWNLEFEIFEFLVLSVKLNRVIMCLISSEMTSLEKHWNFEQFFWGID